MCKKFANLASIFKAVVSVRTLYVLLLCWMLWLDLHRQLATGGPYTYVHCTQAPMKPETRLSPNLFLALLKFFLLLQVDEFFIDDSRDPSIKSERLEPDTETRLVYS